MKSSIRWLTFAVVLALPFQTSCGGASTMGRPDRRPEPTQDPAREMEAQESRLRDAELALNEAGAPCEQRCHAGGSICDAASRICAIARDLGDDRSLERCTRAESSCTRAHTVTAECHCGDTPDGGVACRTNDHASF